MLRTRADGLDRFNSHRIQGPTTMGERQRGGLAAPLARIGARVWEWRRCVDRVSVSTLAHQAGRQERGAAHVNEGSTTLRRGEGQHGR